MNPISPESSAAWTLTNAEFRLRVKVDEVETLPRVVHGAHRLLSGITQHNEQYQRAGNNPVIQYFSTQFLKKLVIHR